MPLKLIDPTQSAFDYPLIIKRLIETPLIYTPRQEIVYRDLQRYDYVTFGKRIARLANALKDLGVKEGDTVGVMDWDSHRYLECYFAVPMMGAVLHTINIRMSSEQILYTINHAEDDVILINSDFLPVLESIQHQLHSVKRIILLTDGEKPPQGTPNIDGEYEELVKQSSEEYEFPDFDENAQATAFYTTGTTGSPKGVYYSHRQIVLHTLGVIAGLCCGHKSQIVLDSGDVYMPLTPLFHVHAWGFPYVCTLLGTKQVYSGRYDPELILNLIQSEDVTFSHCVPTILHMLINSPAAKEIDFSRWKVNVGGSILSDSLCKAALELGIDVYTGYGLSETCPQLARSILQPHMLRWDFDSQMTYRCRAGLPYPLVDLRIVDSSGKALPHDGKSVGEVVARAPWLSQGYLKDPKRGEELWAGGWLHTGDIGFIDKEGYLQITDRIKDVIKTGGEWISSLELENIITQHEAVSEAAAIGIPDDKWGERPVIFVVLEEGFAEKITEDELRAFFMKFVKDGTIPKYGVPDRIIFTDSIPKTTVGKTDKKSLRKGFG